jgi:hypothetical protein
MQRFFSLLSLTFVYSSTCFGRFPAHHQELNDCSGRLWFYLRIVVIVVLCSWSGRPAHLMQLARRKSAFKKFFHLSCNILKTENSRSTDTECCCQAHHDLNVDVFQPVCHNKTWPLLPGRKKELKTLMA